MAWKCKVPGVVPLLAALILVVAPAWAHSTGGVVHSYGNSALGTVVLGLGRSGTPFAFVRDGAPRGFELDLARAVAREMNIKLEVRWLARDALLPALAAGEIDLVNVGALAGDAPESVDVVPYLEIGQHVVVRRDNPFAIHGPGDLSGTMVVATQDSPGEAYARELASWVGESDKAPLDVHTMPMAQYTPTAVLFSHASAYFAPTAAVALQAADPEPLVKPVPGLFKATGRLGFGFAVEHVELKRDLRLALAQVVVKGVYRELLARYHIPEDCSPFR
ncbi:MAG: substrate-binding periplasmic protein [Alphaproteobacteria bacterium]